MINPRQRAFLNMILAAVSSLWLLPASAENSEILPIGVFHFANPGLDLVKTEQINVLSAESQNYLERLASRLAGFTPDHVLLECEAHEELALNEEYQRYLSGNFTLKASEHYQLGFRVARVAGLTMLHCYDTMSIPWLAEDLFAYMAENNPEAEANFMALIEEHSEETEHNHRTMTLEELMLLHNDPKQDRLNKGLYLKTNALDAGGSYVGADATASWWHRNFRMYGNIQSLAETDTRLIVIGGQGHTAVLKDFITIDPDNNLVDVRPYLKDEQSGEKFGANRVPNQ